MSYAIVYSSHTGNTALLAQTIRETLPQEDCVYFGAPDPSALTAETVYDGQRNLRRFYRTVFAEPYEPESVFIWHCRIWGSSRLL